MNQHIAAQINANVLLLSQSQRYGQSYLKVLNYAAPFAAGMRLSPGSLAGLSQPYRILPGGTAPGRVKPTGSPR